MSKIQPKIVHFSQKLSNSSLQTSNFSQKIVKFQLKIVKLAQDFALRSKDEPNFSNKFFYKIRERFSLFNNEVEQSGLSFEQSVTLLSSAFLQSANNRKLLMDDAKAVVSPLLEQCRESKQNKSIDAKENI